MTSPQPTYAVHTQASLVVRPLVLPHAVWPAGRCADGRSIVQPVKGTWHAHVVRGRARHDVAIVPMIACPSCAGLIYLSHTEETARALRGMLGRPDVPIAHRIDPLGRVSPDLLCGHARCDFHRTVYLDRWLKKKPLYAIAYVENGEIKIDYTHAVDRKEAAFHFGPRAPKVRIIEIGPAVGFYVDEKTGRMRADA